MNERNCSKGVTHVILLILVLLTIFAITLFIIKNKMTHQSYGSAQKITTEKSIGKTSEEFLQNTNTTSKTYTVSDINNLFEALKTESEFSYIGTMTVGIDGCKIINNITIKVNSGNSYAKIAASYPDTLSQQMCDRNSIYGTNVETYVVDGKILSRQYFDKNFEEIAQDDRRMTAKNYTDFLPILGMGEFEITGISSQKSQGDINLVELLVNDSSGKDLPTPISDIVRKFEVEIDNDLRKIVSIKTTSNDFAVDGKVTYKTDHIVAPRADVSVTGETMGMQAMLMDLANNGLLEYSVQTESAAYYYDQNKDLGSVKPNLRVVKPNVENSVSCYVDLSYSEGITCNESEKKVRGHVLNLITLLADGETTYCVTPEPKVGVIINDYEEHIGKVGITISNNNRNPRKSLDYRGEITIDRTTGAYTTQIDYSGREYCFRGNVSDTTLVNYTDSVLQGIN